METFRRLAETFLFYFICVKEYLHSLHVYRVLECRWQVLVAFLHSFNRKENSVNEKKMLSRAKFLIE